ncbi:MAG: bifunctional 5,10-methylenetetrahydrofolate dehydrogenase/5,10-methenyltetrahydrofolate cyclohydrolase [Candidatus Eremiobacteraeota bacterium]|nr:bifunctional 5,10-methylenetetrahydrofolate dehydrogenase/5,10-methenyltetrahydrofolate cyclohydrolase [Candidatus Eremiobacteraeota bacterium]MCW5871720.1 bifunctional 5,10-methylenetetrahydrofolate dehydrogenase/5,10-methenyltetrahydrofolate cyclohydrolase [Candidatus Eremiobacteraeota bacterium]
MAARLIDGKAIAASIKEDLKAQVAALPSPPGLATVLVGEDPASHSYIRSKHKLCAELGIQSLHHQLPAHATQDQVEAVIRGLAANPAAHGILVQLPLPAHLDEERVLALVPLEKDVDGFHPVNLGRLAMKGRRPEFVPCTPAGCMRLLDRSGVPLQGARAVVVGRSNIVGLPMALLLNHADATVTIAHSRTVGLDAILSQADVVVAAIGRANFIRGEQLKPGCCVIDVGINRTEAGLVGDVHFDSVKEVAAQVTPVPGGVGPMTLIMLMENTLKAAQKSFQVRELQPGGPG